MEPTQTIRAQPPLLVRADASPEQGAGHVLRSLALAEAWRAEGGAVCFVSCRTARALAPRIEGCGARLIEIDQVHPAAGDVERMRLLIEELRRDFMTPPWVVVDGYHFDGAYQSALRATAARLLVVDDNAQLRRYHADIVLNHGLHAPQLVYRCDPDCQLLLGSPYALIRGEFLRRRSERKTASIAARNLLVTLGGSDPGNLSARVVEALLSLDERGLCARVVVGPMNPNRQSLRHRAAASAGRIVIESAVADLASLMLWADVAIAGAGGTSWELAFLGVPMVNIVLADNQRLVATQLARAGLSVNLDWHEDLTPQAISAALAALIEAPTQRAAMSAKGKELIDGKGAKRVIAAMMQHGLERRSNHSSGGAAAAGNGLNKERRVLCKTLEH
jgi:UDP-2,4-diacetamido-2,4,6-trideoxy-beta-L-altropyranose hydrolase